MARRRLNLSFVSPRSGETITLAYFVKLSIEYSSSSVWPKYFMLRDCLELKERVTIDKYGDLIRFIQKKNVGYRVINSKILTTEQVDEFLLTPNEVFLMMKVVELVKVVEPMN